MIYTPHIILLSIFLLISLSLKSKTPAFKENFKKNKENICWILGILFFYISLAVFNFKDTIPAHDNLYYSYPYFNYIFQSIIYTGELPYWNALVNQGEPTYLFINHNFLMHYPYIVTYIFSPILQFFQPFNVFWITVHFGIILQALGLMILIQLLLKNIHISIFALIAGLFAGISSGQIHQLQINATMLYIIWQLVLFVSWYITKNKLFWLGFCWLIGTSLTNHYPHLIIYFWSFLLLSFLFFNPIVLRNVKENLKLLNKNFLFYGLLIFLISFSPTLIIFYEYAAQLVSPYRSEAIESGSSLKSSYDFLLSTKDTNSFNLHTFIHFIFPKTFSTLRIGQHSLDNILFYIGIIPFFLMMSCFFYSKREHKVIIFFAFIILIFGVGGWGIGYLFLYNLLPFSEYHRLPLQIAYFLTPVFITLSCYGLSHIINNKKITFFKIKWEYKNFLIVTLLAFVIYIIVTTFMFTYKSDYLSFLRYLFDEFVIIFLSSLILIYLFSSKNKKSLRVVLMFLLFELTLVYQYSIFHSRSNIPSNYEITENQQFFEWQNKIDSNGTSNYAGTVYGGAMLTGKPSITFDESEMVLFSDYSDLKNQSYDTGNFQWMLNRFHFIPKTSYNLNDKEIMQTMIDGNSIKPTYLTLKSTPNNYIFSFDLQANGYLIFLDHFDKGWKLKLDNNNHKLKRIGPFKMIELEDTSNTIELTYAPYWKWFLNVNFLIICFFPILLIIFTQKRLTK